MGADEIRNNVRKLLEKHNADAKSEDFIHLEFANKYLSYKGILVEDA